MAITSYSASGRKLGTKSGGVYRPASQLGRKPEAGVPAQSSSWLDPKSYFGGFTGIDPAAKQIGMGGYPGSAPSASKPLGLAYGGWKPPEKMADNWPTAPPTPDRGAGYESMRLAEQKYSALNLLPPGSTGERPLQDPTVGYSPQAQLGRPPQTYAPSQSQPFADPTGYAPTQYKPWETSQAQAPPPVPGGVPTPDVSGYDETRPSLMSQYREQERRKRAAGTSGQPVKLWGVSEAERKKMLGHTPTVSPQETETRALRAQLKQLQQKQAEVKVEPIVPERERVQVAADVQEPGPKADKADKPIPVKVKIKPAWQVQQEKRRARAANADNLVDNLKLAILPPFGVKDWDHVRGFQAKVNEIRNLPIDKQDAAVLALQNGMLATQDRFADIAAKREEERIRKERAKERAADMAGGGGGGGFNAAAAAEAQRNWEEAMRLLEEARAAMADSPLYQQAEQLMLAMMSGEEQPYDAATQAGIYGGIADMLTSGMEQKLALGEGTIGTYGLRGGAPTSYKAGLMGEREKTLASASAQEQAKMAQANFTARQQAMAQGATVAAQKASQENAIRSQMAQMYATRQYPAYV